MAAPDKSVRLAWVKRMAKPVIVHTIMVSMKVPVMEIKPCSTQELVLAAAAAIGAEPKPLSFEKIPRLIPFCIAMPKPPPTIEEGTKAVLMIWASTEGISVKWVTRIRTTPVI